MFCKSILNEYAVKMKLEKPIYHTVQPEGLLPVFKSTAVFNGNQYMGETGKNKKEAEQMAARAAVMSILGQSPSTKFRSWKRKGILISSLSSICFVTKCLTFHQFFCRN